MSRKKSTQKTLSPPSEAQVVDWVRKDLESAHYLLGIILKRYPDIITEMGKDVYRTTMKKENGAAIDHTPEHAQTGLD